MAHAAGLTEVFAGALEVIGLNAQDATLEVILIRTQAKGIDQHGVIGDGLAVHFSFCIGFCPELVNVGVVKALFHGYAEVLDGI